MARLTGPLQVDNEPPFLRRIFRSGGLRWLTSIGAALITAVWVLDTTAGAAQRAWLMERARPACIHGSITNEELDHMVRHELEAGASKKDTLRTVVTLCQAKLGMGRAGVWGP
jgi:hypothetical protein